MDLHTHTTASDGVCAPRELVQTAIRRGLRVLAITDHDSTEGIPEALEAARGSSLELWPGIEVSTDVPGNEVHILGYLIDHGDHALQKTLRTLRDSRLGRGQRIVEKLGQLGMPVSWERVREIAGEGAIGRPHIAQVMVEQGYVGSIAEAFNRYISRTGPAYVERYRLSPEEAVQLIVKAQGFAALAHPVNVGAPAGAEEQLDLDALLPRLVSAGLSGIEIYYTGYSLETTQRLRWIAAQWGLVGTGGSDFHGRGDLITGVGEVFVPDEVIEQVRQRHAEQRRQSGDARRRGL